MPAGSTAKTICLISPGDPSFKRQHQKCASGTTIHSSEWLFLPWNPRTSSDGWLETNWIVGYYKPCTLCCLPRLVDPHYRPFVTDIIMWHARSKRRWLYQGRESQTNNTSVFFGNSLCFCVSLCVCLARTPLPPFSIHPRYSLLHCGELISTRWRAACM